MLPFVNTLILQGAAGVRSLLSPTSPRSPTPTILGNIAGTDADSDTPTPSQQQLPTTPGREQAGTNANTTTPSTPLTPEERRDSEKADADSDTTVVGEEAETASEKRRRKRREKVARQRNRQSGSGLGDPASSSTQASQAPPATPATPTAHATPATPATPTPPAPLATGDGAEDKGDPPRGRDTTRSEGVAGAESGQRVDSWDEGDAKDESDAKVEGDAKVGSRKVSMTVKEGDGDKAPRVIIREVGDEEDEDGEGDGLNRGDATHSEPRLVDLTTSNSGTEHDERPPSYPGPQLIDSTSNNEPERALPHPETQLVHPSGTIEPEHDELGSVLPEPQPVDATSNSEPERDPATSGPPLVNLTTSIFKLVRTEKDPRCSNRRLATLRTNRPSRPQTIPSIKELYPKDGLGPTIQMPSDQFHPFLIDTLDSLHTTPKPKPAPNQPCPNFPESLSKLHPADLADPLRAAYMSATAHSVLTDRLWRTVRLANYFLPDRAPPGINLPQNFEALQRAAVEDSVSAFLSRTKDSGSEGLRVMERFTRANRTMAGLLHSYLMLEMKMTRRDLSHIYAQSCGRGGEDGVEWEVDVTELGALFEGGGRE